MSGKTLGAGRKRQLHPYAVVWIGTECEKRSVAIANKVLTKRAYTQAQRRAEIAGLATKDIDGVTALREAQADMRERVSEDRQDEVRSWQEALRHGQGHLCISATMQRRPKGHRQSIIDAVAGVASKRYKAPITTRMVDKCWKAYRKRFLQT